MIPLVLLYEASVWLTRRFGNPPDESPAAAEPATQQS
jgi:hypothetical protein